MDTRLPRQRHWRVCDHVCRPQRHRQEPVYICKETIGDLPDRVAVMREGRIVAEFDGDAITEENIILHATGTTEIDPPF